MSNNDKELEMLDRWDTTASNVLAHVSGGLFSIRRDLNKFLIETPHDADGDEFKQLHAALGYIEKAYTSLHYGIFGKERLLKFTNGSKEKFE